MNYSSSRVCRRKARNYLYNPLWGRSNATKVTFVYHREFITKKFQDRQQLGISKPKVKDCEIQFAYKTFMENNKTLNWTKNTSNDKIKELFMVILEKKVKL